MVKGTGGPGGLINDKVASVLSRFITYKDSRRFRLVDGHGTNILRVSPVNISWTMDADSKLLVIYNPHVMQTVLVT